MGIVDATFGFGAMGRFEDLVRCVKLRSPHPIKISV
jgi:hypothetical protein